MEQYSKSTERLRQAESRHRKVTVKAIIAPSTHVLRGWQFFCIGNLPKAVSSIMCAVSTMYNTTVNPSAGARRKR